ncbi:hypothetical protein [Clostridium paraputrificum]|uniref:Uncharacterized protein n=1 Tax=Clostridium paraputrificum TaxID=29363 RepID=A0A6N3DAU5_9CLOT
MGKYTEDDFCDLYEKKICDNCGKCLEEQGIDIRAIKIEDIAKTIEENKFLEEEYKKELLKAEDKEDIDEDSNVDLLKDAYEKLSKESGIDFTSLDEDYEDAFDHIEYLDESFFEEENLEEMTEEVFPGVRKLKGKSK